MIASKFLFLLSMMIIGSFLSTCQVPKFIGYSPDNVLEEFVEKEIEHYTGLDLDLSPNSPEK